MRQGAELAPVLKVVAIEAPDEDSGFVRALERELLASGATVTAAGMSSSLLRIEADGFERQVISLDERARVGEYQMVYRLRYQVLDSQGGRLLNAAPIELSRVYSFDEQQALGATQEEALIRRELERDAVRMVMDSLSRVRREPVGKADIHRPDR